MEIRKTIKDLVLKALNTNGGQNVKLTAQLLPYDSNRTDIRSVLYTLEKDGLIEIDKDYNKLTTRSGGQYYTLGSITLLARLTPKGESYYKEHYEKKEELPSTINIDIGNVQNISNSTIHGPVTQSLDSSSKDHNTSISKTKIKNDNPEKNKLTNAIVYPVVVGLIVIVISIILKYVFGITF
ncbi:MAG TPA: hypothetical protein PKC10_00665 [Cyclobacteriaceae bacterium]|nr:hypothetical protein [Cyclobacteriaceae bacterium]